MTRINQLPPSVVTKIAAGEVIERPASVVKELLENSVDAHSTRIELDVEQGGTELIRVIDNGYGIHIDDMALTFASHATSKLTDADDLFHIETMGFRGEAMASIGGVSHVSLQSRPHDAHQGAELKCRGGDLSAVLPWNGAPGTRMEVKHLFFNTPVRKKFLRTTSTEMGHVTEAFTRLALAHPEIQMILRHNNRQIHELPGGGENLTERLRERIGHFFGREIRDQLYEIDGSSGLLHLHGFIADPSRERGNAKMQYVFLNRRWIKDRTISHAIAEAYRGLLMTGRYAVVFLFLEMPADQVDVNVHPTKSEVRFVNSQPVHRLVNVLIRERLREENLTARLQPPPAGKSDPFAPRPAMQGNAALSDEPWKLSPPAPPESGLPFQPPTVADTLTVFEDQSQPAVEPTEAPETTQIPDPPGPKWPQASDLPQPTEATRVIQLYDAYLVMGTPEGMLVIDQHALHERILFEQLKKRVGEGNLEQQRLLIPEPVELSAEQAAKTMESKEALQDLGLEIEEFGGTTILVTAYPAMLSKRSPQKILMGVVDHLMSKDRAPAREVLLNDLLSIMACHAAVRAGDRLSEEQMNALIAQRDLVDDTHHCPHGRPTALLFSKHELDRQFRRI